MTKIQAWFALSRPPFHAVGVLPFFLGTILAYSEEGIFRLSVLIWGIAGVLLIMLATYYAGEYWDFREDEISARLAPSRFAGGSGVLQKGIVPRHCARNASIVCLVLALGVGIMLQFVYRTGPWTLPLGMLGLVGGFFYSAQPVRWVRTGYGELWIAFCYGWLPIAASFYLQAGYISPLVHWLSLPVGLTIFNVILLNEFPDHEADQAAGKKNILVRLGASRASRLYAFLSSASWILFAVSIHQGAPVQAMLFYMPVFFVSIYLVVMVLSTRWQDRKVLERLCAVNILVNLGTTLAYILAFMV